MLANPTLLWGLYSNYIPSYITYEILIWGIGFYLVITLCCSIVTYTMLKKYYPSFSLFWFMLILYATLPFISIIATLIFIISLRFIHPHTSQTSFSSVDIPLYEAIATSHKTPSATGSIFFRLTNTKVNTVSRFQALQTLSNMPTRVAVPLLKQILTDKTDDIRLLAYSILDKQEKRLNDTIYQLKLQLKDPLAPHAIVYRQLAENYWNFVYFGLAQGSLLQYALNEALEAIEQARKLLPDDPNIWMLKGKIHMKKGELEEAKFAFATLENFGLPANRIAPYLAEIAFLERRFDRVRHFLSEQFHFENSTPFEPLVHFWRHHT